MNIKKNLVSIIGTFNRIKLLKETIHDYIKTDL